MTTLILFDSKTSEQSPRPNVEWGTGHVRKRIDSGHGSGTFLYTGEPTSQTYRNTDLTLSNIRINDELIPPPQRSNGLSAQEIPLKFPSNHPFTSHISEKAVFPDPDSNENNRPSTDLEPYIVTHKVRGNPFRREVHFQGFVRNEKTKWPDKQYMQLPRSMSDAQSSSIYPWPRKIFQPNETTRRPTISSKPTTQTSISTQIEHDKPEIIAERLYSPANKVMSQDEHLDDQLRHGTDYVNLPADRFPTDRAPTWTRQSPLKSSSIEQPKEIRFLHHLRPSTDIPQIARDRQMSHQQIEADNRLQQLEVIRPMDNMILLNLKYQNLQKSNHNRPLLPQYYDEYIQTFYDQTGRFIHERSGLYQTNIYNPQALSQSMPEISASTSNQEDRDNLLHDENSLSGPKQDLFQYKTFADYQAMRNRLVNTFRVPDDASTVDKRAQEGEFIQRESVYGQSYNTRKFLQENNLLPQARSDPTRLMNTSSNTNLERIRNVNASPMKSQSNQIDVEQDKPTSDDIILGPFLPPPPYSELYSTKHITEQSNGYSRRSTARVYESPFKVQQDLLAYKHHSKDSMTTTTPAVTLCPQKTNQLPTEAKVSLALPGPEIVTRSLDRKPSQAHSTYQRAYRDIAFYPVSQSMIDRKIFSSQSESRPKQWKLIDLQDRWSKTLAQRNYHADHPEHVPYVGDGTMRAQREILIADLIDRDRKKKNQ